MIVFGSLVSHVVGGLQSYCWQDTTSYSTPSSVKTPDVVNLKFGLTTSPQRSRSLRRLSPPNTVYTVINHQQNKQWDSWDFSKNFNWKIVTWFSIDFPLKKQKGYVRISIEIISRGAEVRFGASAPWRRWSLGSHGCPQRRPPDAGQSPPERWELWEVGNLEENLEKDRKMEENDWKMTGKWLENGWRVETWKMTAERLELRMLLDNHWVIW